MYLRARQYDPSTGRFISEDVAHDGANWYAYCGNDPIKFVDPSGNYSKSTKVRQQEILNPKPPAPTPAPKKPSYSNYHRSSTVRIDIIKNSPTYNPNVVGPKVSPVVIDLKKDLKDFDWKNTDEQKVLNSKYISAYRGQLVIRTDWDRAGSFGIMFLNQTANKNTVRHEWGHFVQFLTLGPIKYFFGIGIPSFLNDGKTDPEYYNAPQEASADKEGGVTTRSYLTPDAQDIGDQYYQELQKASTLEVVIWGLLYWFTHR